MREIKFRGKIKSGALKGTWVYGFYYENKCSERAYIIKTLAYYSEVDSDTVGQFTGLSDIGDNAIYESDILKTEDGDLYAVYYVEGEWLVGKPSIAKIGLYYGNLTDISPEKCTVVGNLYDNLELFGESGDNNDSFGRIDCG